MIWRTEIAQMSVSHAIILHRDSKPIQTTMFHNVIRLWDEVSFMLIHTNWKIRTDWLLTANRSLSWCHWHHAKPTAPNCILTILSQIISQSEANQFQFYSDVNRPLGSSVSCSEAISGSTLVTTCGNATDTHGRLEKNETESRPIKLTRSNE